MITRNPEVTEEPGPWPDYPGCPDCDANLWEFGPRGGAAVNIECAQCGGRFNALIFGQLIQRLPK
jgi:hypothetical protein